MVWGDKWTLVKYGVVGLIGISATIGLHVSWPSDEYVTNELVAAVVLGTAERCAATTYSRQIITNPTVTNVVDAFVTNSNGACWGGTNRYLVPVKLTNVVGPQVVTTYQEYASLNLPEREVTLNVGRVISGYTTNYLDTNGVYHSSPPEDPATNAVPWDTVVSIYTNESPALLSGVISNALTGYFPHVRDGATYPELRVLWNAALAAVPYYVNPSNNYEPWTSTGMLTEIGCPSGFVTNDYYAARTNLAQLYSLLAKLRYSRRPLLKYRSLTRIHNNRFEATWTGAVASAETEWASSCETNTDSEWPYFVVFAHTWGMNSPPGYEADADACQAVPMIRIHPDIPVNASFHIHVSVATNFWPDSVWAPHGSGLSEGWNVVTSWANVSGDHYLKGPWVGAAVSNATPFPLTWVSPPGGSPGDDVSKSFWLSGGDLSTSPVSNRYADIEWLFRYCTNAPP